LKKANFRNPPDPGLRAYPLTYAQRSPLFVLSLGTVQGCRTTQDFWRGGGWILIKKTFEQLRELAL
jgi:hypothetical protein